MLTTLCEDRAAFDINCGHGVPWKHRKVKIKLISCAAKVQHCLSRVRPTRSSDLAQGGAERKWQLSTQRALISLPILMLLRGNRSPGKECVHQ